jgi:hypothetical protein
MLTYVGQAGTNAWICKKLVVIPSNPFFAKPNVVCCALSVSAKTQINENS